MMSAVTGRDTIHKAAARGDLEVVRRFVEEEGVDVDCKGDGGRFPLFDCVSHGRPRWHVLRYLISKNANVEATNANGLTPLMYASLFGNVEVVTILLEEGGANVNYCDEQQGTALDVAVIYHQDLRAIHILLRNGATLGRLSGDNNILHHVTSASDAEEFDMLLNHYRETLAEDDFCNLLLQTNEAGNLALHYAESVEIAKLFIEQPRRQRDMQLLPVCHDQLTNHRGWMPWENTARLAITSDTELRPYLKRYETLALSIPVDATYASPSSKKRHCKSETMCIAVKLNPALNAFQQSVAQEALDLTMDATDCPDSIAHAILGYLSLLDVMKRTDCRTS